jgi:hypothetical protein
MMFKTQLRVAAVALVTALLPYSAKAADTVAPLPGYHHRVFHYKDSCGCLHLTYHYHRELRFTYGAFSDPRSFDTQEPYFYYGPVKAYPEYFVEVYPHFW